MTRKQASFKRKLQKVESSQKLGAATSPIQALSSVGSQIRLRTKKVSFSEMETIYPKNKPAFGRSLAEKRLVRVKSGKALFIDK